MRWLHARAASVDARERMVREQIAARGLTDPDILRAFRTVAREAFLPPGANPRDAYDDRALPLPGGQTISQPYVVAAMTHIARPPSGWTGARVLEIGTGSGYQAAILAELGAVVTTIERLPELADGARRRLDAAGYGERVTIRIGDGTLGDPGGAPWDVILVTAAGPSIPQPLLDQVSPQGGRLVMPVGSREHQVLTLVERHGGELRTRELDSVVFVPLLGAHGFPLE